MAQSIEPNIADLANGWLRKYKLPYKLEQQPVNTEIDKALSDYHTKAGNYGGNRPDAKLIGYDKYKNPYPVLIEYKGYKDKLVKLDKDGQVENRTSKNEPNFKNINSFAVNGAVHYANALLHHTSYTDIIAIGMTGYKDETGKIHHEIGVYYVSKSNLGVGQKIGEFTDFSFLAPANFDGFIETVKTLQLSQEELDKLKEQREREIDQSLVKLNNDIYQNEKGLGENDRVYLVAASIIATLGIPEKVKPLEKSDLKSSTEKGYRDGDLMIKKIESFLSHKELPDEKKNLIVRTLSNTLLTENINKVQDGESQLKRVFTKIVDDLGIYYKIGLTTDFTGKLFNEMYGWLGFSEDKLNDVMLNYGFDIIKTLVTDIDPDAQVKDSMNRINASEREKVAAQFEGDAQRILIVERAKAEAESKRLQGQGIADQRREIARGLEDSVKVLNGVDINSQEASALIVVTQHYDTLQSVGSASNSNLILMPNSPQAGSEMLNNMVASFTASNQIGEEMKKAKKAKDTLGVGMKPKKPEVKQDEPPMDSSTTE